MASVLTDPGPKKLLGSSIFIINIIEQPNDCCVVNDECGYLFQPHQILSSKTTT